MDRMEELEEKVNRLQRAKRWYRLGGVVAVLALAGMLLVMVNAKFEAEVSEKMAQENAEEVHKLKAQLEERKTP